MNTIRVSKGLYLNQGRHSGSKQYAVVKVSKRQKKSMASKDNWPRGYKTSACSTRLSMNISTAHKTKIPTNN